ncbi:trans-2-enoyl-CoA reductase family protein [Catenovulum sp. 2E275]|uniref:enoyl-ACP reductase FabV n=1 Tax=Catenovulum sp. 2E275 TaxID=2980497 RepID=UPI0021D1FB6A|nr:enoyl-ACP reductase FabV [Catenovulum sp. 2E275]MCU4674906.1 trans-2-enoyl-CoA reductase family protein [Catenovulum sp. 2E275]
MVIKPKVRGFICTNAHPKGCAANVQRQIEYVKQQPKLDNAPKNVLVIGSSTGYGLASRIMAAFNGGASTLGVFFEKPASEKKTGSAGWYNSAAFQHAAEAEGLWSKNINGDAFSDECKQQTIDLIKAEMGKIDLVVYSLASPRRKHPKTGELISSTLKPIEQAYTAKNLNTDKLLIEDVTIEPANQEEIDSTVAVMGGEDWEMWIDALKDADVLADGVKTVAYTYIGDKLTWPIYGDATIGKAKEHLYQTSLKLNETLADKGGEASIGVLKALVTQASSAIPIMPLYISLLYKVMKEEGTHEGCIEQAYRLFAQGLYTNEPLKDPEGRYRMDLPELKPETQAKVEALWPQVTSENIFELTDYKSYNEDFLKLFGFGFEEVDYDEDVSPVVELDA